MTFKMANLRNLVCSPVFHGCPKKPAILQPSKCVKVMPIFLKIILNLRATSAVGVIRSWGWMTGFHYRHGHKFFPSVPQPDWF